MKRTKVIIIFFLLIAAIIFLRIKRPRPPNIIFITIDTLRADHVGCYGYKRQITPNIDRLAKEGVYFKNCFATSSTTAFASVGLLTGRYLMVYKSDESGGFLDKKYSVLGEYLDKLGYFNAAFLNNPHYYYHTGFERGFRAYKNFIGGAEVTTNEVIGFLKDYSSKKPFFLWVHYIDPHDLELASEDYLKYFENDSLYKQNDELVKPQLDSLAHREVSKGYMPKMSFRQGRYNLNYYIALYDAQILFTDYHIGRLLGNIKDKNTLIVLTADHGQSLGEHGIYLSHGESIYDEVLRVPLVIKDNRYFKGGKEILTAVSSLDIVPTILGRVSPISYFFNKNKFNGVNLKKALNKKDIKRKYIYFYFPTAWGVRDTHKNFKYILNLNYKEEFYLLPDENNNLIDNNTPDILSLKQKLENALLAWLRKYPIRSDTNSMKSLLLDEKVKNSLKSLGYIE